jgi:hypothetical protein
MKIDPDKLFFPCDLAESVGLSKNEISFLKRKGCPFFGRKTTLRWVREFLAKETGASRPVFPNDPPWMVEMEEKIRQGKIKPSA